MEKHYFRAESQSHTKSETKVSLGELDFVTTSKAMRCPQGPPYIDNTRENITRSFGNGCERRVHPCFTDQLLEKQFLKAKGQGTP